MKPILLGISLAGLAACGVLALLRPDRAPAPVFSRAGRDRALLQHIRSARQTVYVRTRRFALVPVANELLQALQQRKAVQLELPLGEAHHPELVQLLMEHGAVVQLSSEPAAAYEGSYVLVDGRRALYSAAPLDYGVPGIGRSFLEATLP